MSELRWPIFLSAHTPSPLSLLFSLLSAFFFFSFLFLSYYYERHLSANSLGDFICLCSAPPCALPHHSSCFVAPILTVGGCDITVSAWGPHPRQGPLGGGSQERVEGGVLALEWDADPDVGRRCTLGGRVVQVDPQVGAGLTWARPFCSCSLATVPGRGLCRRRAVQPGDHRC